MKHRCRECTLVRCEHEGDACEECIANGATATLQPLKAETVITASGGTVTYEWTYAATGGLCGTTFSK